MQLSEANCTNLMAYSRLQKYSFAFIKVSVFFAIDAVS